MPLYVFKNPNNNKIIEIVQKMTDKHVYVDQDGVEWQRVFLSPNTKYTVPGLPSLFWGVPHRPQLSYQPM